jgi:RHS repeat-associated protein
MDRVGGRSRIGAILVVLLVAISSAAVNGQIWAAPGRAASAMDTGDNTSGGLAAAPSATGSFVHSVPIQVPAFRGLEPRVSLDYDSATGNGEAGVGWRLTAGSTITRSGSDGALPRYDGTDAYLVDGEELVSCAPDCVTGGTHETRKQSYDRFVFDGKAWTRWYRDGTRLVYEPDAPADDAYQWSLTRVTDTHGNAVIYAQDCPSHCSPSEITYAAGTKECGQSGQDPCKPGAAVRFHYEIRPDVIAYPTGRATRQVRHRLRTIEVRMDGHLVTAYALGYIVSRSTGNSVLRSLQQFPADASVSPDGTVTAGATEPLPPVAFSTASTGLPEPEWIAGIVPAGLAMPSPPDNADFPQVATSIPGDILTGQDDEETDRSPLYGDFDGDHRIDAASWNVLKTGCSPLYVRLAARPQGDPVKTSSLGCGPTGYVIDLDGDGADDILAMSRTGGLRKLLSHRDGTFIEQLLNVAEPWFGATVPRHCGSGDVNGDQLGDLVCVYGSSSAPERRLGVARATPDGGMVAWHSPLPAAVTGVGDTLITTGDVDNSGTDDIMLAVGHPGTSFELLAGFTEPGGTVGSWQLTATGWAVGPQTADWNLSGADFDGDARTDYGLLTGSSVRIGLSEKGAPSQITVVAPVVAAGYNVAVGDADGDGRADLLTGDPARLQRSNGDGTFAVAVPLNTAAVPPCRRADAAIAAAGDANGDGQADLLCATTVVAPDASTRFDLWAQPTPVAPPAPHRWAVLDHNGDGRQDLYTLRFDNPGYRLYTAAAKAGGGYDPVVQTPIPPVTGGPALDDPDAGGWLAMDVGGPKDEADGRSDLVRAGRQADGALQLTTVLSTGSGWTTPCTGSTCVSGADVPDAGDVRQWRPARINGDDRGDLVRFRPLGPGVRVEYLLAKGDGTWLAGHRDQFTAATTADGAPLTRVDVASFRTVDLNRDGLDDFVHVEVGGGPSSSYSIVRSLLSTGPGTWREEQRRRFQPIDAAVAHALRPVDLDGDGIADLGRAVVSGGCMLVEAYLRQGSDWSTLRTAGAAAPCMPAVGLEDRRNLMLGDVNHDGRTDVYHLARVGLGATARTTATTLLNPGDWNRPWHRPVSEPSFPIANPDSWAWTGLDTDSDGVGELAHIGPGSLRTLRFGTGDDRITGIDNGRGATTSIGYRAQPAARSYLPAGTLPIVVDQITVSDTAHQPVVRASVSFAYDGARWSVRYRRLIGYGTVRADQGGTVVVTGNDLGEACGARQATAAIQDPSGAVLTRTSTEFAPPGGTAPYGCRPAVTVTAECERTPACQEKRTAYRYDDYGNVVEMEESGDAGRRLTYTPVRPNATNYLVDRPYERALLVPNPAAPWRWVVQERTLYGYDDQTWKHPPLARGDLTQVTQVTNLTTGVVARTSYRYDGTGNLIWTRNPSLVETSTNYDPQRSLFPISDCTVVGCSSTDWDETLGVADALTDLNQQTTYTRHDAYRRPVTTVLPDGGTTTVRYLNTGVVTGADTARQRVRTEIADGSPGDGVQWHEELIDGLGRVYRTRDEGTTAADTDVLVTDTRYRDASDRPAAISLPHSEGETPRWTVYGYDPAHRPVTITHPGAAATGTSRSYGVGAVQERDELGHVTTTAHHDAFGRTVRIDEHVTPCLGCPAETQTTAYDYDAADRPLTITDAAGLVTTIVRDAAGQETSVTDPDRGTRTRIWRPDGKLSTETDASGVHTWTYDAAGRPQTRTDTGPSGTQKIRWDYDRDPATGQPQGDSLGRLTVAAYSSAGSGGAMSGTDRLWYDALGRTTRDRHCVDTVCREMGYSYDDAGRLQYLHYPVPGDPDGENVRYTYDGAGRLTSVGGYLTGIGYNAAGQPTQQRYGNGLIEQRTYDPDRQWLDGQTLAATPKPTQPVFAAAYQHDQTARVTYATTANRSSPVSESFGYDELGRLTSYTTSDPPSVQPLRFEYDALGRMTRSPAGGVHSYDDPSHPHAVTSTTAGHTRTYDTAGNVRSLTDPGGRALKIDWTPTGMPQTIAGNQGSATMAYGADGQRVRRTTATGTTYYLGRYLEQDDTGLTRYYWAGDLLIARRDPGGKLSYLLQDRLRSTRVVTDETGAVTGRYDYQPYGAQKPGNQVEATSRLWQGQRAEPDNGLVYMNARYYDPELGQFTAPDSIVPDPASPQTLDRYSFGDNDPMNKVDPSGHMSMRVELKKELDAESARAFRGMYNQSFGCGVFVACVRYSSGMTVTEEYTGKSGHYQKNVTYSGGLDAEGNWNFGSLTDTTDYGPTGAPTPPPLLSAPEGDPSEWAPFTEAVSTPQESSVSPGQPSPPARRAATRPRRKPRAKPVVTPIASPAQDATVPVMYSCCAAPIPAPVPAPEPSGMIKYLRMLSKGWGVGLTIDISFIQPVTSGGGGSIGLNDQYLSTGPDQGLRAWSYMPAPDPSHGLSIGISIQGNISIGNGPYSGLFDNYGGSVGSVSASYFESPGVRQTFEGWQGISVGLGLGLPILPPVSGYGTRTDYHELGR